MEGEEKKEDGKTCCSKASCCCKAFKAIVLVLVGGVAGFFAGRHCGMCPLKSAMAPAAPAAAPAQTPAK